MSKTPGTHRLRGLGLFLLAVAAALLPSLADASSTIRAFAQRHQATGRVDSVLIGNQLLNCPTSASGCTAARNGSGNNNSYVMIQVDVDADATTFNSSRAPLALPVGSTVQRAYLYWGADTTGAGGGSVAPDAAIRNQVLFSAAGGAYTTVTATTLDALTASRYSAVADVTSLVQAAGNGTYTVANVQSGTGTDRYAGWSLVVIYSNSTLPLRSITLFDGSLNINNTAPTSITTTVSGFRTPATGAVDARIGLVAFEGDNAMTGDQFLVNSTTISDALNPNNNVFNSTNSRLGVAQTGRNPQQSNMFGFDIDYIPVAAGVINNNDTSASLTFNTGGETYFPIALLFQTNVYEPEIVTNFSKAAVDLNGGQFRPGDIVEYTISLSNTGDDAADQTVITDPLPLGLTYVPGSIEVLTGPNAGAKTDAAGDDQAEYDAGTRTLTVRVGTSANASTGGRITPVPQAGSATSVRFRAQIDANQPNGANLANIAGIGYVGATSGTPGSGNAPPSTITVSRNADLSITKTGPANVVAGAPIQYVVTVASLGPDAADGATVTDNVPAGITGVSITCAASGGAVCPGTAGLTTLSALAIPTMPSGGQVVFTINGTAPMSATSLSNSASVAAPAGTVDAVPGNNSAGPVVTTVDAGLDLAVTGALTTVGTIRTGDPVAYQFTVINNGPVVAPNAPFTLPMPTGLVGGAWTCAPLSRCGVASGTGDIALTLNLAVGESVTITFGGTAPATTPSTLGDAVGTVAAPPGLGDNTPGNNTATVPAIVVQARDLVANPDSGSIVNGNLGGTAVPNVLANDQFNGGPATLGNVTLSQVSTTHPNVTLDPGTGAIVVAPGTPSGSYTVVYQICETSNPGNCTQASVTVDVTNTPPVVQDDTATVVQSSTGNAIDVLANDSDAEDGAPVVTPASGSTANGGSFNCTATGCTYTPPLGFVGSDSFSYQACDSAGECGTAIVNITVQPRTLAITAAPFCLADAAYLDYSIAGGNFDATGLDATIEWLDGLGSVVSTLTNQPLSGQLLWPGMVLNAGVPVDWPGWVLSGGLWIQAPDGFEGLRPTATVRITVNPTEDVLVNYPPATPGCAAEPPANQPPVAVDDSGSTVGLAPVVTNVLANDSDPEAGPLVVSIATPPGSGSVVVNGDGSITYTPAPGFQGVVTYEYTITDAAGLTSTATVTITVDWLDLAATADTGTVADGAAGGVAVPNVLANDTLDGAPATLATVSLAQVSTTNPNVTLDPATGEVEVAPGTPAGSYTLVYEICELANPANCEQASVTVTVGAAVIDAVDDDATGTPVTGAGGGTIPSVLGNDTLGGAAVPVGVGGNATLSPGAAPTPAAGSITMNADGTITIAPGTSAGVYSYGYTICEVLNPTNCDTATVTIVVAAAVIDAIDDSGTVASGASGGTAVANVLANDTLDGAPATLATVSLSQLATSHPNVTLDPATGAVAVAPGTPAGTYTVTYEVCELLNPSNCDVASVTVTVGAAPLSATDDTGAVANGAAGGVAVANVLANDTLDGVPATLATVVLSQTATTHPNVTLNPATGEVSVAPGTPAGTYTVTYQICEQLNPTNCSSASVTVTVGAAVIDAVDDDATGTPVTGAGGGTIPSVLGNDTLGGSPVTVGVGGNVTLSPGAAPTPAAGSITMNADGSITIAAGTSAGVYSYGYTICEVLNPTNCDTATVTLVVDAAVIDALDDSGTVTSGASGGVAVSNVLANDTLDGSPATLATVTLAQVSTSNPNVTLDPATGAVAVAPGTPAGTYTVTYQICEQLNPTNCDLASVTVTAGAAVIDAVDDSGTVASGAAGGTAVPNVLANDTLGGAPATLATVSLSQVSTSNPNVTLDPATGAVNVAPGAPAGTYTVVYQVCEVLNPANCDTATVTVTVGTAVIDAVDDVGTVASGAAGGVAVPNVLINDSLDGSAATLATVTLSQISTSSPNVTLDPANGAINVAAGTPAGTYTVVYQICEVLNPANCDTATVTATVGAAVIDAVDDTGTVASGAAGGVAAPNVLANDTLGGSPATLATVTLSQVSTTSPNVTLDPATGAVNVSAGTPAGTYSVVYQICEVLNPTNCDSATVTVTVGAAVVDAVDDTGTVTSGAAGGTAVPNVLANDTLGGAPATLAAVALSQVSTTNPNVALDPATGAITVSAGTPAGTYAVVYQICEILNPTNCDQASVTVTVGAAIIEAVDDTGAVASGAAGGMAVPNVLANDTLDGAPATLGTVTLTQVSTSNPNVTLDPASGAVNVAPGTPAGTYTVVYEICEQLNPTNCDQASVTVTVGAAAIDAVDDSGTVASGATGGIAVANVLVNDTLDGAPATLATVTLTQVSTSNPNVTLDPATGAVNVAPGTAAGTYTLVYEICEILNPTNCDQASATVTVGAAIIEAVDDTGAVASGAAGGMAVPNVLANDTLDGAPATLGTVTLTQVSTSSPNVTLDPASGAVNVASGTPAGAYTVVYQICEILNPTNCDQASVTVTVGAAVIDAVDDTGTVGSGATGGIAIPNVLVNDTLDGAPATLATVTLAQISTTNPNVTVNPATGEVVVAAGTPAGTYTVVYEICEILNPTNCDQASVTVTVGAAVIDAVDDTGTVASGATGGLAVPNVLVNDTLDGAPATLATVTLTQVSTTNPGVTLNPATGEVVVAAATPAGTYTLVYEICEILNPTNCDQASATVTVGAAVIDAFDDNGTVASGATGGIAVPNVLVNDTLDGAPATLATVTLAQVSTSNPNVTLDPATGAVNVAPGTAAGTYTVVYEICEILNPANCDTATVTVTVGAAVIDAVDDTGTVASGAAGGVAVPNVLVNDTLDGAPATLATVTLAQISTTNPNVTLDPATGAVNVAPGTAAGSYTLVYEICEILNPANCDTATVTVTVGAAVIDAVDDTGSVASGAAGGTAVANVLVNDTLDGTAATLATVTLAQVSTTNPNVTLDPATGAVNVAPGTAAGTYTLVYEICEVLNPTNCDQASVTVTVGAAVIDAVDDTGTVASGAAGGVAVPNVLVNDTLDGAPATLATVTLAQISTTNPNVALDPATGAVNVAPGTAAGTYSVVYQICELLNPANCDTATVTVTVGAAVIDAVDDTGTVASGAAGGVAVPNVLVNDTLDGAPATLATVSLSQVSTSDPNVTLDPATGAVNVAPGTAAGAYTVVYQICELLNPANCDTATATVTVGAAVIDAVDDSGTLTTTAGGTAIADVLVNDTLDGNPASLATVTLSQVSTSDPNVTLDPATGAVNVAPGTPAGTYTLVYEICEILNPANCDQATATVTVIAPAVAAADDTGATAQNTPVTVNVLANDGFGGGPADVADVTVTIIAGPANGSAVVNADGSITYTPAANYSGPDQLRYRICGVVNPGVCAEAVVDLVVAPNTVTAPDDSRVTTQATPVTLPLLAMAGTGGGAPLDPASLQIVGPAANGTVVINPDGSATYTPNTLFFGTDSFQYRICDQSVPTPVCAAGTITITVEMATPQLRISKTTPATTVRVGDFVRYSITVENTGISPANNVTVLDLPPAGFTYVEGSLAVVDADGVHGLAGTQPLRITGVDIPVGGTATIAYLLRVGAGTGPGVHTNTVSATDAFGVSISNTGQADVIVEGDPLLEESLVLGTVFLDTNGDGRQQSGEPGLAGVRLATVEGLVVETDVHGRFHLVGIDGGHPLRGRNAILKVDVATLPPGSRFTTPNPLVRRITPGIPVRFDFGVQLPGQGGDTNPETR